jgi:tRNA nucleotidyltransferase (CCA-adding enzyme)
MKKIIEKARRGVIPTKKLEQEKSRVATIAFDLVYRQVSKYPQIVQVEFGGSYAKGTWLP